MGGPQSVVENHNIQIRGFELATQIANIFHVLEMNLFCSNFRFGFSVHFYHVINLFILSFISFLLLFFMIWFWLCADTLLVQTRSDLLSRVSGLGPGTPPRLQMTEKV